MDPHSSRGRGSVSPYHKSDSSSRLSDQDDDNDNVFLEDNDHHHHRHHHHITGFQQQQHHRGGIISSSTDTYHTSRTVETKSSVTGTGNRERRSESISECSDQSQCESPLNLAESKHFRQRPTQPKSPNPSAMVDPFQSEKEFIDYLLSLPSSTTKSGCVDQSVAPSRSDTDVSIVTQEDKTSLNSPTEESRSLLKPKTQQPSILSGTQSPKIGLDHLENLCKLMEQLGELREQNLKLQKRVQYLEEVRCLNEMRKDLKEALEMVSSSQQAHQQDTSPGGMRASATEPTIGLNAFDYDSDVIFSTTAAANEDPPYPRGGMSGAPSKRAKGSVKLRKTISKQQRGRSQSMGDDELFRQFVPNSADGGAVVLVSGSGVVARKAKAAKVSKWSKVKEALKWERAQTMDQRISVGGTSTSGATDARSSFYVETADVVPQVSRATITLTTPSAVKAVATEYCPQVTFPSCDSGEAKMQGSGFVTSGRGLYRDGSGRATRDVTESLLPISYLNRDSYLETSSDEEVEVADDHLGRKGRSLERDTDHKVYIRYRQSEKEASKKMSKGAWGKVKNIIQTRKDSLKRKHRKSGGEVEFAQRSSNNASETELSMDPMAGDDGWTAEDPNDAAVRHVVTLEQGHFKSKHSSSSSTFAGEDSVPDAATTAAKPRKVKPQLTIQSPADDLPLLLVDDDVIKSRYPSSTCSSSGAGAAGSGSSPTSPRRSKWTKVKSVFIGRREGESQAGAAGGATGHPVRPHSVPASPTNLTSFSYDDFGILEDFMTEDKEWEDRKQRFHQGPEYGNYDNALALLQSILTEKQAETELIPYETKRHLEELQRNVSHDFSKKLQEWEKLKTNYQPGKQLSASSHEYHHQQQRGPQQSPATPQQQHSPKLDRKGSGQKTRKAAKGGDNKGGKEMKYERTDQKGLKQREKELQWLEKQLQKIEREKQRLAKERQKYLEREARLEKMKETMMKPSGKNEILVRTSAGEFRFEGISQTFTRKLYEWEEMRGIGPEVSTIALLDSTHHHPHPSASSVPQRASSVKATSSSSTAIFDKPSTTGCGGNVDSLSPPSIKYGRLDRNRSRSESSIADIVNVQTSTTSLAPDDYGGLLDEYDAIFSDLSRANSEPDLAFVASADPPYALEVEELHFEESIPCLEIPAFNVEEPVYSYAPSEVTRLIDSGGSSDVEKEPADDGGAAGGGGAVAFRRTTGKAQSKKAVVSEIADGESVPQEGAPAAVGREDAGSYGHYLLDEDISLLETLTAKEKICRQLETDLENLDGKMKLMFQQHSEEIQKLRSQEGILKDMEVEQDGTSSQKSSGIIDSSTARGSPENSMKQKQLIEQLKARIIELEMAGECLKRERQDLEETFKKHTEHQGQLTQHLAARITELQQESLSKKTSAPDTSSSHERMIAHSKKKEGVVKVQNLSAELLQQAKTLEQALQDRNSTIRQLQWELLQRDMSAIQLQGELEKVKEKSTSGLFRSDSKLRKNHNRSWSSVDAAYNGQRNIDAKKMDSVPLQIHKISDSPEFAALPVELTKKVRELKTELMRLWSSGESANSVGSDQEEGSPKQRKSNNDSNGEVSVNGESSHSFGTSSRSTDKSSSVETVIMSPAKPDGGQQHPPPVTSPRFGARKTSSAPNKKPPEPQEPTANVLTTRRVSDTSIPSDPPTTPDFGRHQRRLLKSKMQRGGATATETTIQDSDAIYTPKSATRHDKEQSQQEREQPSLTSSATSSPMVSRIPSRIYPLSPKLATKIERKIENADSAAGGAGAPTAVNYTISLKPRKRSVASREADKQKQEPEEPMSAAKTTANDSSSSNRESLVESSVTLPNPLKAPPARQPQGEASPVTSTVVAVVALPRKQLVRSPALRESMGGVSKPRPRRGPHVTSSDSTVKPAQPSSSQLQRQNAEDPGSTSEDTDTEDSGSGVTFTINIGSKMAVAAPKDDPVKEKKACATVATAVSTNNARNNSNRVCEGDSESNGTPRIPLRRQDKLREQKLETQSAITESTCSQLSGIKSPTTQRSRSTMQDPTKAGAVCTGSIRSPPLSPGTTPWRSIYGGNSECPGSAGSGQATPIGSPGSFRISSRSTMVPESSPLSSPAMVLKMASSLLDSSTKTKEVPEETKLVAPETPVVKSRSTRKLKIPTASKNPAATTTTTTTTTTSIPVSTTTFQPSQPPSPHPADWSGRRPTKDPAPSVKNMIEKYNLNLATVASVTSPVASLLRSPQLSSNRLRYGMDNGGVKKSTSFTAAPSVDPNTFYRQQQQQQDSGVSSVVKSASAGKIDSRFYRQLPPMSPELPSKRGKETAPSTGPPQSPIVGIASRIPRCLKAICEQEHPESVTTNAKPGGSSSSNPSPGSTNGGAAVAAEEHGAPNQDTSASQPPSTPSQLPPEAAQDDVTSSGTVRNQGNFSRSSGPDSPAFHSPITGIRALQIRRAREEFLTKIPSLASPSATSPATERHPLATTAVSGHPTSPTYAPTSPLLAGHSGRQYRGNLPEVTGQSPTSSPETEVTSHHHSAVVTATKPKGILKASRRDMQCQAQPEVYPDVEPDMTSPCAVTTAGSGRIVKSASAGNVDEATMMAEMKRAAQDAGDGLSDDGSRTSTDSAAQQQQKSGLFNFKFRKAKLKQKRESQSFNAVKALCRQSLVVDMPPSSSNMAVDDDDDSTPQSPPAVSARSCPSSPELQPKQIVKSSWLMKPKYLFKSK